MRMLKEVILFLSALFIAGIAAAKSLQFDKKCGEYKYIITVDNAETVDRAVIKHYYQERDDDKRLFYTSEQGMLVYASCLKDKNNLYAFIFTESCDGSGCNDGVYGLFSPKQRKLLLKPSDWPKGNKKKLIHILGFEPDVFNSNKQKFCCSAQLGKYRYDYERIHNIQPPTTW